MVDGIWVQGVILANSSLSPGSKTKVTPPSTSELYILPVALFVVVAGVLLLKYGKRR